MTGLSGNMSLDSQAVHNAAIEKALKEAFSGSTSVSGPPVLDAHLLKTYPSLWDAPFIPKSQFIFVRPIGEGSFGRVYKGILYDQDVAIKELTVKNFVDQLGERANSFGSRDLDDEEACDTNDTARIGEILVALEREVSILRNLRHQKIVMFLGVCLEPPCIITEYCQKGSLYALLARARDRPEVAKRLTWKMRIKLALDAAIGMNFLHGRNIPVLHRDLKTPNLLVDEYWNCKVADFNTSRFVTWISGGEGEGQGGPGQEAGGFIDPSYVTSSISANNPRWLAPEVLEGEHHTKASDVYPFGLILWELLTWTAPWEAEAMGTFQIFNCVVNQNLRPEIPDDLLGPPFFDEYKELMTQCWDKDPAKRPGYPEIVHRLTEFKKLLETKPSPKPAPPQRVKTPDPPCSSPRLGDLVSNPFKKSPPSSPRAQSSTSTSEAPQDRSPFQGGPRFSNPAPPPPPEVSEPQKTDEDPITIPKEGVASRGIPNVATPGSSPSPPPSSRKPKSPPSFAVWSQDIASKELPRTNAKAHWKNLKALLLPDLGNKPEARLSAKWEMLRDVVVSDMVQQGTDMGMETVVEEAVEEEAAAAVSQKEQTPVKEVVDPTPENQPDPSTLLRRNSKWSVVRDVFGSQTLEEERHPGWNMLKNILLPDVDSEAPAESDNADPLPPPTTPSQEVESQEEARDVVEEPVAPKTEARSKWEVLRHILFSDDVPRNPGWDVVQEILLAAPSSASTMPSIDEQTTAKPVSVAGKRWAKLKEVFVSEEPVVKRKKTPQTHPGWQVIMQVLGTESDSAASSRTTSRRSSQTSGSSATDRNEHELALSQIQATDSSQSDASRVLKRLPSKAERYWSFLRHMMSNNEGSLLVRHWDFLNAILNEQKGGINPSATSTGPSGPRRLKSPASKRWKKVRDLLIVDYDPPSPEKWSFLREWLMRDDELGEDWEDLRSFARERVDVPEGGDWDLFRTLFFEDRGVRTHPHWAFLKDLLVKDATPTSAMPEADEFPVVAAVNPKKVRDFVLEKPEPPSKSRWSMVRTLFMDENAKPEIVRETVLDMDAEKPPEQSKWDEIRDLLSVGSGI
ncbi:hypothetical protein BSKO_10679 [Bryopsis sp. KO-2023]|nr:hypothetical protein BSKO_10679 [Bryopsis sp. KO-2023]